MEVGDSSEKQISDLVENRDSKTPVLTEEEKFEKWRKRTLKSMPNLAVAVFSKRELLGADHEIQILMERNFASILTSLHRTRICEERQAYRNRLEHSLANLYRTVNEVPAKM